MMEESTAERLRTSQIGGGGAVSALSQAENVPGALPAPPPPPPTLSPNPVPKAGSGGGGEEEEEGAMVAGTDQERAIEVKIDTQSRGGAKREREP